MNEKNNWEVEYEKMLILEKVWHMQQLRKERID